MDIKKVYKASHTFGALRMEYARIQYNKEAFVHYLVKEGYSKPQIAEIGQMMRDAKEGKLVNYRKAFEVG